MQEILKGDYITIIIKNNIILIGIVSGNSNVLKVIDTQYNIQYKILTLVHKC